MKTKTGFIVELDDWRSTKTLYGYTGNGIVTSIREKARCFKSEAEANYKAKQYSTHNPRVVRF